MHYYEVAPIKIVRQDQNHFTYKFHKALEIGSIVEIEIGNKTMVGVVIKKSQKPSYKTKSILEIIEDKPIPKELVNLSIWISEYYLSPLALVLQTVLPRGLDKKRHNKQGNGVDKLPSRKRTNYLFNKDQQKVIKTLKESSDGTFLLQGVTGSGKTAIYIETIKNALESGKSALLIVPEIALTSQIIAELSNHFKDIFITHSKMTESNRHIVWRDILNSKDPIVILGPRSALFMPVSNLGVVIIDESHEPSLKQEKTPKYSALRVATILGKLHDAKVIFGSATPSIVDRYLAEKSEKPILKLPQIAIEDNVPPTINVIDMRDRHNFLNHRFISDQLIRSIEEAIKNKKQSLVFHNRRGSASSTICENCGWIAECPNCLLPTVLHTDSHILKCHICGVESKIPTSCPQCGAADIIHKGIGTKLIEAELIRLFPGARIARFDADNSNADSLSSKYQEIYDGSIDIIIGTQIVAKGLDLPNLQVVGVIQADTGLSMPDFSINERTFQLLSQVIGRVGRNNNKTNVIVQTYQPKNPVIQLGIKQDYESFYSIELLERKKKLFPPFTHLLKLTCNYKTEKGAITNAKKLAIRLRGELGGKVMVLGPSPDFYEYKNGEYRWQLILKSPSRSELFKAINILPKNNWQFDLDPVDLL